MGIDPAAQGLVFLGAALLGMGAGLTYDLLRLLRRRVHIPLLGPALDFIFWLVVTGALFFFAVTVGRGELRFFMIAALFMGTVVYFLVLSAPALCLAEYVADAFALFWRIVTRPVVLIFLLSKKIEQNAKNYFHYWRKWFKIRLIPEEMKTLTRAQRPGAGGVRSGKDKESGVPDQTGGSGPAHLHGHSPAEPTGPDSECPGGRD